MEAVKPELVPPLHHRLLHERLHAHVKPFVVLVARFDVVLRPFRLHCVVQRSVVAIAHVVHAREVRLRSLRSDARALDARDVGPRGGVGRGERVELCEQERAEVHLARLAILASRARERRLERPEIGVLPLAAEGVVQDEAVQLRVAREGDDVHDGARNVDPQPREQVPHVLLESRRLGRDGGLVALLPAHLHHVVVAEKDAHQLPARREGDGVVRKGLLAHRANHRGRLVAPPRKRRAHRSRVQTVARRVERRGTLHHVLHALQTVVRKRRAEREAPRETREQRRERLETRRVSRASRIRTALVRHEVVYPDGALVAVAVVRCKGCRDAVAKRRHRAHVAEAHARRPRRRRGKLVVVVPRLATQRRTLPARHGRGVRLPTLRREQPTKRFGGGGGGGGGDAAAAKPHRRARQQRRAQPQRRERGVRQHRRQHPRGTPRSSD
mmetsp:Transcript_15538/g.51054  ORF Transcript_15538/g.51054 Transcript_15538/m.51054 type:complete len:442 (+) Transcript_15538:234-1559(+)